MSTVHVTWRNLIEFIAFLGYPTEMDPGCVQVLALQGCKVTPSGAAAADIEVVSNVPDIYNDCLLCVGKTPKGAPLVIPFPGTVNPGKHYTQVEPHPQGAANITFGLHEYVLGLHQGKEALRAKNELNRIWRDKDGDFTVDPTEQVFVGVFGTNIHPGGRTEYVGKNSGGCLNVAGGWSGPWVQFLDLAKQHLRLKASLPVVIWSASDLVGWLCAPDTFLPTVVPGVLGTWATAVQAELRRHGSRLIVDGDWRAGTTAEVVVFQKKHGLLADGIVGPKTWSYLLG